jgi:hypothetical protein
MKLDRHDLSGLSGSLLTLLLLIAFGAVAVFHSRERLLAAQAALSAARTQRNEIVEKLDRAHGEENEIRRRAEVFKRLATRGMIGKEQRLAWVELLKELRDRLRLIQIHYEFSPQRALDTVGAGAGSGVGLYASSMKLEAKLLHEEDLTRLLDELRRLAPALIQVRRCDVERLSRADADQGADPDLGSLRANCLIDWITLREAEQSEEDLP